ncbi:tetratricopeptide repeat protein, partial [Streptomyces roseoverticillatus]|uniref:tetratricopeptide repeat protein n=1 Tax=Streptomyces roseoverticillatus TaxID=66429 RepID=UPI0033CC2FAA
MITAQCRLIDFIHYRSSAFWSVTLRNSVLAQTAAARTLPPRGGPEGLTGLGEVHERRGQYGLAAEDYREAVE